MKRTVAIFLGSVSGAGLLALVFGRTKKATGQLPSGTVIIPPPPDAVWLRQNPEAYSLPPEPGGAPASTEGGQAVYVLTGAGGVMGLDAGKFLDDRFGSLPLEQRPTETQLRQIAQSFTALGVDTSTGIIRTRPTTEALNATLDLATAFDMQNAPPPVGAAVRDFGKMSWQLPAGVERKA